MAILGYSELLQIRPTHVRFRKFLRYHNFCYFKTWIQKHSRLPCVVILSYSQRWQMWPPNLTAPINPSFHPAICPTSRPPLKPCNQRQSSSQSFIYWAIHLSCYLYIHPNIHTSVEAFIHQTFISSSHQSNQPLN